MRRSFVGWIKVCVYLLFSTGQTHAAPPSQLSPHANDLTGFKSPSSDDLARMAVDHLAQCIVERDRRKVLEVLGTPINDPSYHAGLTLLSKFDCLPFAGQARMTNSIFRGSLFSALYAKDFKHVSRVFRSTPLPFAADIAGGQSAFDLNYVALHEFADCVVRANPSAARSLILAEPATPEEARSFEAIAQNLNACIDKGRSVQFSKIMLIGLIAEALYRENLNGDAAP